LICSVCEILVPMIFCLLFKIFRDLSPPEDVKEASYYNKPLVLQASPGLYILKQCSESKNSESGGVIALAPKSDPIMNDLATYFSCKESLHPNLPSSCWLHYQVLRLK